MRGFTAIENTEQFRAFRMTFLTNFPPRIISSPMSERTWKRKYRWVQTWPEEKEDWSAFHDGLYIGRVSRDRTSLKRGMFLWSGGCSEWPGFQGPMPHNGRKHEAWEAAKAVEDWYDEGLARSGPRPALVAQRIGPLDEDGLPLWLRG
ncbi:MULTISPECIES: hypothetical protein [unclassified Shinella]|uniref:hypothetical protein n=1 Tax=unclassified Shinella TaxID=2643062 RepID=UPI0012E32B31|nr:MULTISPECIES: hypothetical protein [unclassified Shinella]MCA0340244.1 hypothetical protein [Pseudomonadota bacterium]